MQTARVELNTGMDPSALSIGEIAILVYSPNSVWPGCAQPGDIVVRSKDGLLLPTSSWPDLQNIIGYKVRRLVPGEKLTVSVEKE